MSIILAPLQGISDLPFRKACFACLGNTIDFAISPFVSLTHGIVRSGSGKFQDVLPVHNRCSLPVVPQILGGDAALFVDYCSVLSDLGYGEVNWNLGCPTAAIVRKHRGAGLLPYPEKIAAVLERVFARSDVQVSLKMRLGLHSPNEGVALLSVLNAFPLKSIVIHPRLGDQMYDGDLDMETFTLLKNHLTAPVVFNGDIKTGSDLAKIQQLYPDMHTWMIGRGLVANPFLALQIKQQVVPSLSSWEAFHGALFEAMQTQVSTAIGVLNRMKEYWNYWHATLHLPAEMLFDIKRSTTTPSYLAAVKRAFAHAAIYE